MVPTAIEKQPPHVCRLNDAISMMVYNILYSHEDNDGLSLQQGGGWDSAT